MVGPVRDAVTSAAADATCPLYTANRTVEPPEDPVAELWQHCTTLREHRGDGHVTALRRAGSTAARHSCCSRPTGSSPPSACARSAGWTDEEWEAACARLRDRDLVDDDGAITDAGRNLRVMVERATDAAARVLFAAAAPDAVADLTVRLDPLAKAVAAQRAPPLPQPDRGATARRLILP